jgi:hypothetical protein
MSHLLAELTLFIRQVVLFVKCRTRDCHIMLGMSDLRIPKDLQ